MVNCTVHINDRNWTRVFCPTAHKRPEIVNSAKEDIQVETVWLFYETVDSYVFILCFIFCERVFCIIPRVFLGQTTCK